ncbi:hypothetical protein ACFQZ8_00905 [Micromonospora azadirachtae]|uniref:Uncharacterized protein n=1 Tax=Micromonospora azadirachtae TaxID=1970735 RepID=A0ABW2ZV79_9ACTN
MSLYGTPLKKTRKKKTGKIWIPLVVIAVVLACFCGGVLMTDSGKKGYQDGRNPSPTATPTVVSSPTADVDVKKVKPKPKPIKPTVHDSDDDVDIDVDIDRPKSCSRHWWC